VFVCCAFPRGARGDWLVEKATELGAAAFVPLESDRSVLHAGDGRIERWRRIAIEAAEQSGRAVVPTFAAGPPPGALALVADLDATLPPARAIAIAPRCEALALYIGPEGGWTAVERVAHAAAGHVPVRLGPRPLRVETAVLALLTLAIEALPPL
jgi:16S rRNA (uracil1498-N3)-methyltransferase